MELNLKKEGTYTYDAVSLDLIQEKEEFVQPDHLEPGKAAANIMLFVV